MIRSEAIPVTGNQDQDDAEMRAIAARKLRKSRSLRSRIEGVLRSLFSSQAWVSGFWRPIFLYAFLLYAMTGISLDVLLGSYVIYPFFMERNEDPAFSFCSVIFIYLVALFLTLFFRDIERGPRLLFIFLFTLVVPYLLCSHMLATDRESQADSASSHGHIYQLTYYVDINTITHYSLYECGSLGIVCHRVDRFPTDRPEENPGSAEITVDDAANMLSIVRDDSTFREFDFTSRNNVSKGRYPEQ
jgi:hypothetical protein